VRPGQVDKALTQLQLLESLNDETMLLAQVFRPVINCEMLRAEIFAGKRTPSSSANRWNGSAARQGQ